MQQPECPPSGKVMVLRNSFFAEWKPDIVEEMFDSVVDAEEWVKDKLENEPGDLYVIVEQVKMFWAQIKIKSQGRRKTK